ncbi:hypothetical protein DSO57_1025330 [Entomophthora muscae]|uniref:Uncharacterized protein n=1 Tax=Entomophthora muscae TaxID=34485 RepID=A0ACC2TPK8_9FUNG|nr:hypothetical protein DSO57_1025330 [Entomophthora muscae]
MSIQMIYSSAINACLNVGSKLLPWMPLNALATAIKPFQVVATACFYSFSSRSSSTDNASFNGITATFPLLPENSDVVMFVGIFFTDYELPPSKSSKKNSSQACNMGFRSARTTLAPNPLDLDELSLLFDTNCRI